MPKNKFYKDSTKGEKLLFDLTKDEVRETTRQRCSYCDILPMSVSQGKIIYGICRYADIMI